MFKVTHLQDLHRVNNKNTNITPANVILNVYIVNFKLIQNNEVMFLSLNLSLYSPRWLFDDFLCAELFEYVLSHSISFACIISEHRVNYKMF